jgi:thiamine biosynthesis lipoprotein
MGTTWRLYHSGSMPQSVADALAALVEADEERWSRFRETSELEHLNRCAGIPVEVSPETAELLEACDRFGAATEGLFAPLVGVAMRAWGYRESIRVTTPGTEVSPEPAPVPRERLVFDRRRRIALVPRGALLDLGGIAKSWSAVRAARLVTTLSDDEAILVDAGGDMVAARGEHRVLVESPRGGDAPPIARVLLREGQGVATSGSSRRRWTNADGREAHHLIDPATGAPAPPGQATVVATDPVEAEILAKVLVLRPDRLADLAAPALVAHDDDVVTNDAWKEIVA